MPLSSDRLFNILSIMATRFPLLRLNFAIHRFSWPLSIIIQNLLKDFICISIHWRFFVWMNTLDFKYPNLEKWTNSPNNIMFCVLLQDDNKTTCMTTKKVHIGFMTLEKWPLTKSWRCIYQGLYCTFLFNNKIALKWLMGGKYSYKFAIYK